MPVRLELHFAAPLIEIGIQQDDWILTIRDWIHSAPTDVGHLIHNDGFWHLFSGCPSAKVEKYLTTESICRLGSC